MVRVRLVLCALVLSAAGFTDKKKSEKAGKTLHPKPSVGNDMPIVADKRMNTHFPIKGENDVSMRRTEIKGQDAASYQQGPGSDRETRIRKLESSSCYIFRYIVSLQWVLRVL